MVWMGLHLSIGREIRVRIRQNGMGTNPLGENLKYDFFTFMDIEKVVFVFWKWEMSFQIYNAPL